jgi:hypothetical protein
MMIGIQAATSPPPRALRRLGGEEDRARQGEGSAKDEREMIEGPDDGKTGTVRPCLNRCASLDCCWLKMSGYSRVRASTPCPSYNHVLLCCSPLLYPRVARYANGLVKAQSHVRQRSQLSSCDLLCLLCVQMCPANGILQSNGIEWNVWSTACLSRPCWRA